MSGYAPEGGGRFGLRIKFTLIFYLVTLPALAVVGYFGYDRASDAHVGRAVDSVNGYTSQVSRKIDEFMSLSRGDLFYMSEHFSLLRQLYWRDMNDQKEYADWSALTLETWNDFVSGYDYLFKARFVDLAGREQIVIRRDPVTRQVAFLDQQRLQSLADQPWFRSVLEMGSDGYLVSEPELNREMGQIERPLVPVVRLARPVYGENRVKYGVMVLDLFADTLFDYIRQINQQLDGAEFFLINDQGRYLFHPQSDRSYDHLTSGNRTIYSRFPELKKQIVQMESEVTFSQGDVVGFRRIYPHHSGGDHYWVLVGVVDERQVLGALVQFKLVFAGLLLLVVVLVFLVSHFYVGGLMRPVGAVTRQLRLLAEGRVVQQRFDYRWHDELRGMLDSASQLTANLERMAAQADTIARGDFSHDVELLSAEDRLGVALGNMTIMLREAIEERDRQDWLKDGVGRLSQQLAGESGIGELAERSIALVGDYLQAGRGALFIHDEESGRLELLGSYMLTRRSGLANHFLPGEGLVGQSARERKPIELRMVEPLAEPVASGTATVASRWANVWPLLREGELLGVVEVSGFEPLTPIQRQFLSSAAETIASFLFMAIQRQRITNLLDNSERSAEQLRLQTDDLQRANAQMEEQQQQLQQQTEELQQTNAQMEEQQQQLQQQTEELQQTNAQMEEQQQQLQQQSHELSRKNAELLASKQELDQRATQLEDSNRYKSEFLANMSHELRTPLNSIIILSRMLMANEKNLLDGESVEQSRIINDAGNELLRLINDILDLSKIEAGKVEIELSHFASSDFLAGFNELFSPTAREKGLEFVIEDRLAAELHTDQHKLSQVVRNLLSNAFKFTREGRVELRILHDPADAGQILIEVQDTGVGIPVPKRELVFDEFQQVDGSISREFGGTGLGLSICRRLMALLGGEIGIGEPGGVGSLFYLRLPLEPEAQPVPSPAMVVRTGDESGVEPEQGQLMEQRLESVRQQPAQSSQATARPLDDRDQLLPGDRPILVIDDDPNFCRTVVSLNRSLGYKSIVALNGKDGIGLARRYRPAGVVLDLGLPDLDGMEVLGRLKATRELNAIPVYIITGKEQVAGWRESGAVGFLQKPVSAEQLSGTVRLLCDSERTGRILMVVGEGADSEVGRALAASEGVELEWVSDVGSAINAAQRDHFDVAIVDHPLPDGGDCTRLFTQLRVVRPEIAFVVLSESELTPEEEMALRPFTDSFILRSPEGERQLMSEVEHFVQTVNERRPDHSEILPEGDHPLAGRTVLVVDDDPRNLYVVSAALESRGAAVVQAINGKKALAILDRQPVDLLLLDIMMPEMNGYETIDAIRAEPRFTHLPIITLTAKAMAEDRSKALARGANDYLAKPVDYDVLIRMVVAWCERSG